MGFTNLSLCFFFNLLQARQYKFDLKLPKGYTKIQPSMKSGERILPALPESDPGRRDEKYSKPPPPPPPPGSSQSNHEHPRPPPSFP